MFDMSGGDSYFKRNKKKRGVQCVKMDLCGFWFSTKMVFRSLKGWM